MGVKQHTFEEIRRSTARRVAGGDGDDSSGRRARGGGGGRRGVGKRALREGRSLAAGHREVGSSHAAGTDDTALQGGLRRGSVRRAGDGARDSRPGGAVELLEELLALFLHGAKLLHAFDDALAVGEVEVVGVLEPELEVGVALEKLEQYGVHFEAAHAGHAAAAITVARVFDVGRHPHLSAKDRHHELALVGGIGVAVIVHGFGLVSLGCWATPISSFFLRLRCVMTILRANENASSDKTRDACTPSRKFGEGLV
ncbi:hypothetical protein VFPFJ_04116 [Purpureocillium lilacinum]|uniref:Uncharacterized protein n=1 Tax=Purpureocillium lilacinum TaxID=33203 RepID=A0A179HPK2_PURLI|nr:hypothetical protein VFPFJ_04116 [Purpureocillium lilacinum]OAQ92376.1 hypothetical protein VFPFJ_04116 [Purpureocillium lilacinum]